MYSRLWSFCICSLRSRECGLYEAGDLLLGYHLTKIRHREMGHRVVHDMAKVHPDSDDIFEGNPLENFNPERPDAMEDVCLYVFVSKYDYAGKDEDGARNYNLLNKPRLPNHKIFLIRRRPTTTPSYSSSLSLSGTRVSSWKTTKQPRKSSSS